MKKTASPNLCLCDHQTGDSAVSKKTKSQQTHSTDLEFHLHIENHIVIYFTYGALTLRNRFFSQKAQIGLHKNHL